MISVSNAVVAVCVLALAAPARGQEPCQASEANSARLVDLNDQCSKNYQVCRTDQWRDCSCVLGRFNLQLGRCERFAAGCPETDIATYFPELGRKKRSASNFTITSVVTNQRVKRQACPTTYECPTNVNQVVVYPDWEQSNCNTFHVCYRGSIKEKNCPVNYYYNPHLLSCEQYPDLTNACVWRQYASYPWENSLTAEDANQANTGR